tara:strand:+ start:760 stop:1476 length:717 start_codon:yes stop_codon:yes gene_type:complete
MFYEYAFILPAYNEQKYTRNVINNIKKNIKKFSLHACIVFIDDGSKDQTYQIAKDTGVDFLVKKKNEGKGSATKVGFKQVEANFYIIHDVDLEYDTEELCSFISDEKLEYNIIYYGSRVLGAIKNKTNILGNFGVHKNQKILNVFFNHFLGLLYKIKFNYYISDSLTAIKIYPNKLIKNIKINTFGFETDHEISCIILKNNYNIKEFPISYFPRSISEGKKIKLIDAFTAVKTIFRND